MPEVNQRLATSADLPRLVEIYNQAIVEGGCTADLVPFTLEQRQEWFLAHQQAPYLIYVLEEDGEVLGYFYFSPWRGGRAALRAVAEVSYYLAREARGRGLGRTMLAQAERLALQAGLSTLLAILLESNTASRVLLERGGFSLAGLLPGIADLGGMHSGQLIMYKQLPKEAS